MKIGKLKLVFFTFVCLFSVMRLSWAQGISLYTEDFKPYQYINEQGVLDGFGVDLVTAIFDQAGIAIKDDIRIAIWNSAYQTVLKNKDSAIFMTVRNDKRESLFKWVGPLAPREMWLYKLKERNDIEANTLLDAKKYLVGGYKSAQTDYLEEMGFPHLDIVLKESLNFKKLLAGRIDLMPSSEIMMMSKLKDQKLSSSIVEKVIIFDRRYDYYLALNKSISDTVVDKLQSALIMLKNNGDYQKIKDKYLSDRD